MFKSTESIRNAADRAKQMTETMGRGPMAVGFLLAGVEADRSDVCEDQYLVTAEGKIMHAHIKGTTPETGKQRQGCCFVRVPFVEVDSIPAKAEYFGNYPTKGMF